MFGKIETLLNDLRPRYIAEIEITPLLHEADNKTAKKSVKVM